MNPQHWQRIEEIYHAALPLVPGQRAAYVSHACEGDAALEAQVQSLLEADESSGEFLETQIFDQGLRIIFSESADRTPLVEPESPDPLLGKILDDRFRIDRELGHGGIGRVYLASDLKLHDKPVVVKVLLEKSQSHLWFVQKFQQEKEALARVDHPGVVGIVDAGELEDGDAYIVMQFVDGISLRAAIKAQPEGLDLERVAAIVRQAGSALHAVHQKKIFHRDLKPENIMLQRLARGEEQVKILDFGVAKVKESMIAPSTVTGTVSAGTIAYMSPEQLRRDRVTAASDIYSLALIAYEMATGRRPYNPDTEGHLADMQREGVRVKPSDLRPRLPKAAEAIILRALAFNPNERYQDAAEFGDELGRALTGDEDTLRSFAETPIDLSSTVRREDPTPLQPAVTVPTPFTPVQPLPVAPSVPPVASLATRVWPKLALMSAVVLLLAIGGILVFANRDRLFSTQRSLTYWLTVQKMRDGKPFQEPFQSSGQEVFENDYQFRLHVSSPESGYLYVFNEGATAEGAMSFNIIYPTPSTNDGSAKTNANQNVSTSWNEFGGRAGTEHLWLAWSPSSITALEAARDAAFKANGKITDAAMVRTVREFLDSHTDPKLQTQKDTARQQTQVTGRGDVLVKLVELEHR